MNEIDNDEVIFAALAKLPEPIQHPSARTATLNLTLRALGKAHGHHGRWPRRDLLVPAVLCLTGALYTHGAVTTLVSVFGSRAASMVRAAERAEPSVANLRRAQPIVSLLPVANRFVGEGDGNLI